MISNSQLYFLCINIFFLLIVCLETVKTRWEFGQEYENQAYLQVAKNKLTEINFHLQTEYYHLNSPSKIERHAKEKLKMIEITQAISIRYEK
ncbi:cell division protein FtsL [Gammaproteobacteria bacterium]|nr:cell division protein FtsL [Gammaproteobacteria bacterium]